jgi:SagB-type dehydrogenase family enzyme
MLAPKPQQEGLVLLGFRGQVTIEETGSVVRIQHRWGETNLGEIGPGVRRALRELARGPVALPRLIERAIGPDIQAEGWPPEEEAATLLWALGRLEPVVTRQLIWQERRLLLVVPLSASAKRVYATDLPPQEEVRLSRLVILRSIDGHLALECPLAGHRVFLLDPRLAAVVAQATEPISVDECSKTLPDIPVDVVRLALGLLTEAGMLQTDEGKGPAIDGRQDSRLRLWEEHDLLFHWRSRRGLHDYPTGATLRFGTRPPERARRRHLASRATVLLPRPDLSVVSRRDLSLTAVLESRRSVRVHGPTPITLAQLGDFLFRVAGPRPARPGPLGSPAHTPSGSRHPYPSAGAAYELDLYIVVGRCDGLTEGAYFYDSIRHQLYGLDAPRKLVREMLREGAVAAGVESLPNIVISMVSQFDRLASRYESIAYALTLKNVGVLMQTMYLVATAMGIAPCALGTGDSDLAIRAFGLHGIIDCPVGEFLLGSAPSE